MAGGPLSKSKRFNEIFHIMLEHRLPGLAKDLALLGKQPARPAVGENGAETVPFRVRRMMEDLGPTFIKIGQLLGTRPDLIPQDFIDEFKKMYDATPPSPYADIVRLVEEELGQPIEKVFRFFDKTPIASASIAQVHRATLKSGETVAVKVQHPGIEERMQTDFQILKGIVQFTERVFAASRIWQPVEHLEEVRLMLNKELDFRHELRTMQMMEQNFREVPEVKIPHPHVQLCSKRVLVMEFVKGFKLGSPEQLSLTLPQRRRLAEVITHAMARQIFIDRLFHADPSPGNVLFMGPKQVCFLDFGAVGQVTKRRSQLILEFLMALSSGNLEETGRVIVDLCEVRKEYDPKQFLYDLERIIEYYETERTGPADPVLLQRIIDLANRHGMLLPPDFMLITRSLYQFDGMCKALDPDYELVQVLSPFVHRTMRERLFSAEIQKETVTNALQELAKLAVRLPGHLDTFFTKVEKGQLSSRVEIKGLEEYKRHHAAVNFFLGFTLLVSLSVLATILAYTFRGLEGFRIALFTSVVALLLWALVFVLTRQELMKRP